MEGGLAHPSHHPTEAAPPFAVFKGWAARAIGQAVLTDGRIYAGTTTWAGKVAFRPAFVNWRTTGSDVDLIPELNRRLVESGIPVRRLEPVRASLEERFLAITSRLEDAS